MPGGLYVRRAWVEFLVVSCRAFSPDAFFLEPRAHGAAMRCAPAIVVALSFLTSGALVAQQDLRPALSGRATSVVSLSIPRPEGAAEAPPTTPPVTIVLDYGQPHLRGRKLHTDSLVPYDKPWRTGANDATTLTTGVDLVLGGATLPAGKYVLYTIPTRGDWKLIIQKEAGQTAEYKPEFDVARVDLKRRPLTDPVESLTMWLIPSTAPGKAQGELRLAWGTSLVSTTWSVK